MTRRPWLAGWFVVGLLVALAPGWPGPSAAGPWRPPALGASRTTDVTAYNLADGSVYYVFSITYSVLEELDLSLPAGQFHALGTGQVPQAPRAIRAAGRTFSLDGRTLGSSGTEVAA